jgi:hypothetical protein
MGRLGYSITPLARSLNENIQEAAKKMKEILPSS